MAKTIVITGGAGFIGSYLVERCLQAGNLVHVVDNLSTGKRQHIAQLPDTQFHGLDLRELSKMHQLLHAIKPQWVFHLAAIHYIPYCDAHPLEASMVNILGTQQLLQALPSSVEKIFFASTAAVYPPQTQAHCESDALAPMDIYGLTKLAGESMVRDQAQRLGALSVIGRLFNAIGLRETNPHLLPEIFKQLAAGKRSLHLGNLFPQRDFIHAADMARAIYASVSQAQEHVTYNIGAGIMYSVAQVVEMCEQVLGEKIAVISDPSRIRPVERPCLLANIDKIKRACDWHPEITLQQTLTDCLRS